MRGGNAVAEGLATRELRLYVLACAAMSLALWAFTVVLAITAYKAGGTGAVTLAVVARVLPGALSGPFTALLADRHSRRAVLAGLTAGATLVLAALTLAVALGAPLWLSLVLAAGCSILTGGQQPAQAAMLAGLARNPRQLAVANSLRQGFGNAAYCVGALAGGAGPRGCRPRRASRSRWRCGRFSNAIAVGAGLIAVPLLALAAVAGPIAAIAGFAVLGLGYAIGETAVQTLVQRLASDESLARGLGDRLAGGGRARVRCRC